MNTIGELVFAAFVFYLIVFRFYIHYESIEELRIPRRIKSNQDLELENLRLREDNVRLARIAYNRDYR